MSKGRDLRPASPGRARQRGISLVEILVGMGIGLMVALAAASSLIFVRMSAATAEDSWRLQQDSSTAFRVIGWQLRQAGARPLISSQGVERVEFSQGYVGYGSTAVPQVISGTDGVSRLPDVLQTSLQNDAASDTRDCLGLAPAANAIEVQNRFSVASGDLSCTGVSATAAIVSGVEDLQVWYGESGSSGTQLRYSATPTNWGAVTAVMVCLRMSGERQGQATVPTTGCNGETVAADGRLRSTFVRVYRLRNIAS